ncbi:MAG TPA: O-antigen ligase family protein [Gaiellales bacterium]|nr:O-antigen ligase family protein [Gaiellales bacterium]
MIGQIASAREHLPGGGRFARPTRPLPVWTAGTVAAAIVLGVLVGKGHAKFALLPVAGLVVFVFARVPWAGYLAILVSVATAFDAVAPPEVGLSSLQFLPAELLLWASLACLMFMSNPLRGVWGALAARRESVALGAFLLAVIGGVVVGVAHGASVHDAAFDMRLMLFYAAFWPALAALALPSSRRQVFRLVAACVVVVVALQAAQVIIGPATSLFWIAPSDVASTLTSDTTGFLRVRPPGLTLVYVGAAFSLACLLWGPRRHRRAAWVMSAVTLSGVVLSLNRNMLIGLALGLSVAALVAPQRRRFVVMAATLVVIFTSLVTIGNSAVGSNAVASRITSITNYSELKTQTLDDRYYENRIATARIHAHPILGLGWGPPYGAVLQSSDDGVVVTQVRPFMHEQYLWIWMRAGIAGLLALLTALAFGLLNGLRWFRARWAAGDGWLGAGVVVALVAQAASSNVAIYLTPPDSVVPLVGVLALAAVLRRELALLKRR